MFVDRIELDDQIIRPVLSGPARLASTKTGTMWICGEDVKAPRGFSLFFLLAVIVDQQDLIFSGRRSLVYHPVYVEVRTLRDLSPRLSHLTRSPFHTNTHSCCFDSCRGKTTVTPKVQLSASQED